MLAIALTCGGAGQAAAQPEAFSPAAREAGAGAPPGPGTEPAPERPGQQTRAELGRPRSVTNPESPINPVPLPPGAAPSKTPTLATPPTPPGEPYQPEMQPGYGYGANATLPGGAMMMNETMGMGMGPGGVNATEEALVAAVEGLLERINATLIGTTHNDTTDPSATMMLDTDPAAAGGALVGPGGGDVDAGSDALAVGGGPNPGPDPAGGASGAAQQVPGLRLSREEADALLRSALGTINQTVGLQDLSSTRLLPLLLAPYTNATDVLAANASLASILAALNQTLDSLQATYLQGPGGDPGGPGVGSGSGSALPGDGSAGSGFDDPFGAPAPAGGAPGGGAGKAPRLLADPRPSAALAPITTVLPDFGAANPVPVQNTPPPLPPGAKSAQPPPAPKANPPAPKPAAVPAPAPAPSPVPASGSLTFQLPSAEAVASHAQRLAAPAAPRSAAANTTTTTPARTAAPAAPLRAPAAPPPLPSAAAAAAATSGAAAAQRPANASAVSQAKGSESTGPAPATALTARVAPPAAGPASLSTAAGTGVAAGAAAAQPRSATGAARANTTPAARAKNSTKAAQPDDSADPSTVAKDAPPLDARLSKCTDVAPGTRHTCAQQREWGKCDAEVMVKYAYCARTCGRAPCPTCDDKAPTKEYDCKQQAKFGKCGEEWMAKGGYCARSCGRMPCPPLASAHSNTTENGTAAASTA